MDRFTLLNMFDVAQVTIASGASLSGAVDLNGCGLVRIQMPAGWDAAVLTFQVSLDGLTFANLYDRAGNEYTVQVAASSSIIVPPSDFAGLRWLKVRSGTAGVAVNQTAERVLNLMVRPL
jgi:hypothetical protein